MLELKEIIKTLSNEPWFRPGIKILCACSGGLDSTVLLHLLNDMPDIEVAVVHFNHQLRGEESDSDRDFVIKLARGYGLDVHVISENIQNYANTHHLSFEEAGSRRRKVGFHQLLDDLNFDVVATGQHLDDQIETILMNLYLGTGIRGLSGISKFQDRHSRPLLGHSKSDLEAYSKCHKLAYRVDKTNADPSYLRNNIRAKLVPLIQSDKNSHIETLFQVLSQQGSILNKKLGDSLYIIDNIDVTSSYYAKIPLGMGKLSDYFSPIQKVIFDSAFHSISSMPQGLSTKHFENLKRLLEKSALGKEIHLPASVTAIRNRDDIVLFRKADCLWQKTTMSNAVKSEFPFFSFQFREEDINCYLHKGEYFWYSHGPDEYLLRHVQDGDAILIADSGKRISVKQVLQEAHVAPHLKQYYPVLEYAGEIHWVPGVRTSKLAMVNRDTIEENEVRRCIRVEFQEGTFE